MPNQTVAHKAYIQPLRQRAAFASVRRTSQGTDGRRLPALSTTVPQQGPWEI
jgi:hypothetical protein